MWELGHKKGWAWKNWCFQTVVLEKTLQSPLRSNQSILKEISHEYSLEGPMLKLKLQYFDHLMQRTDSLEKTLMLGKIEGRRRRGWQRTRWLHPHHWLNGREFEQTPGRGEEQGNMVDCTPWGHKESDTTERLNNNSPCPHVHSLRLYLHCCSATWMCVGVCVSCSVISDSLQPCGL